MFSFLQAYAYWHYVNGIMALSNNLGNLVRFLWHVFSIPDLLATLLAPWHRLHEEYKDGFDIKNSASSFLVNSTMRLVGATVRLLTAVVGLGILLLSLVISAIVLVVWIILPLVYVFIIGMIVRILV